MPRLGDPRSTKSIGLRDNNVGDAQRDAGIIMIGEMVAGFFGLRLSAPGSMTHH